MNKMNQVILNASAVLALLNQEQGFEVVAKYLSNSIISAVNFSEVIAVLGTIGMPSIDPVNIANEIIICNQPRGFIHSKEYFKTRWIRYNTLSFQLIEKTYGKRTHTPTRKCS